MRHLLCLLLLAVILPAQDLHSYCWGFLNAVPDRAELPDARIQEIQNGHMAHMQRMADAGRLVAAGPLATPGGPRGLLVYKCENVAQAVEWTMLDPAVVNKRLTVEFYPWKSPGVFGEPLASKLKADPAYKYQMVQLPFAILMRTAKSLNGSSPPDELLKAHFAYSMDLRKQGKLRAFGPFEDAPDKWGVLIYAAMDPEEAQKLAAEDPIVKQGWASPLMHRWYVADEAVPRP